VKSACVPQPSGGAGSTSRSAAVTRAVRAGAHGGSPAHAAPPAVLKAACIADPRALARRGSRDNGRARAAHSPCQALATSAPPGTCPGPPRASCATSDRDRVTTLQRRAPDRAAEPPAQPVGNKLRGLAKPRKQRIARHARALPATCIHAAAAAAARAYRTSGSSSATRRACSSSSTSRFVKSAMAADARGSAGKAAACAELYRMRAWQALPPRATVPAWSHLAFPPQPVRRSGATQALQRAPALHLRAAKRLLAPLRSRGPQ
jgi:hypothetical protein